MKGSVFKQRSCEKSRYNFFSIHKITFFQITIANIQDETMFAYVHCYLNFADETKAKFFTFPPTFKGIDVNRNDMEEYMIN